MSYHQQTYLNQPVSQAYGNPRQPYHSQAPSAPSYYPPTVLSHVNYQPGSSYNAIPVQSAASMSNRQVSTKAKMERFIIRKSEHSVIIRDLSFFCAEQHLQSLLNCYGEGIKVHLCRSEEANHRSLLHAFVELGSEEAVMNLIEELNGVVYMGRQMKIQRCQGHLSMQDMISLKQIKHGIQVHVRFESMEEKSHGLVTEERLREIFADCGNIEDAIVQRHSQNLWKQKGYGFIFFEEMESAERAVQMKNGIMFDNVYYQAAFTHKTKEKLTENSGSVDFGAPSYDNFQNSLTPSFSMSMSRDEFQHTAQGYPTNSNLGPNSVYPEANSAAAKYGAHPLSGSRDGSSYGSYGQVPPSASSPVVGPPLTYSRSGDTVSGVTSLESGGVHGYGQVRSQQPSPSYSPYGTAGAAVIYRETDDEHSTNSTPQNPSFLSKRAFSTASTAPSDGYTTADPSPAAGYSSNTFARSFLLEGDNTSFNAPVGIAAAGKESTYGIGYGSQGSSPSNSVVNGNGNGNGGISSVY